MTPGSPNVFIAVSGELGSGKSRISSIVAERLSARVISTGRMQRQLAEQLGMTTLELNRYAESHPEVDERIDSEMVKMGEEGLPTIFDSRLAWKMIPHSFKVHLIVDPDTAATRIISDRTRNGERYSDFGSARSAIEARRQSEIMRFREKYGVDCEDPSNYHLIIETSRADPESIANSILSEFGAWKAAGPGREPAFLLSPQSVLPTRDIRALGSVESVGRHGMDDGGPVSIIRTGEFYFIYDGHRRVSAALRAGLVLIPALLIARDDQIIRDDVTAKQYAKENCIRTFVDVWEEAHGFKFERYPGWINAPPHWTAVPP